MVNRDIVNYLREGVKRGFQIDKLKNELSKGGFHIRDIEEAIFVFSEEEKMRPIKQMPKNILQERKISDIPAKNLPTMNKKIQRSGKKWMVISGWIGILIFILASIGFTFGIMNQNGFLQSIVVETVGVGGQYSASNSLYNSIGILIGFSILALILHIIYNYGFIVLGRNTESKSLKFSGIANIFLPIIVVTCIVISVLVLSSLDTANLIFVFCIWILLYIFYIIMKLAFVRGLIFSGKHVRFATLAGIFCIIFVLGHFAFLGMGAYQIVNIMNDPFADPLAANQTLSALELMNYIFFGTFAFGIFTILLSSMALISASKEFED